MTVAILSVSGIQAGENEVQVYQPSWSRRKQEKPPIIHLHGGSNLAPNIATSSGQKYLSKGLTARGHHLLSQDLGASVHWGNPTAQARAIASKVYSQGTVGTKAGKALLSGISMGGQLAWILARDRPDLFSAAAIFIPALSIDYVYQNNISAQRATIEAALGIVFPAALPVGIDPTADLVAPACPVKIYIVTDDVFTPIANYDKFKNFGPNVEYMTIKDSSGNSNLGHTETAIQNVDTEDVLNFYQKYS